MPRGGNGAMVYTVVMATLTFDDAANDGYDAAGADERAIQVIDDILDALEDDPGAVRATPYSVGDRRLAFLSTRPVVGRNADAVVVWQRDGEGVHVWRIEISPTPPLP